MKNKFLLVLSMAFLLVACSTSNAVESHKSLQFVVEHILSTEDKEHLEILENSTNNDEIIDEFKRIYGNHIDDDMLILLPTRLTIYQKMAYNDNKNMLPSNYQEKDKEDYIEVSITVTVNDQEVDLILHGQVDGDKVTSISFINENELEKLVKL